MKRLLWLDDRHGDGVRLGKQQVERTVKLQSNSREGGKMQLQRQNLAFFPTCGKVAERRGGRAMVQEVLGRQQHQGPAA